jgi:hypothetical protein
MLIFFFLPRYFDIVSPDKYPAHRIPDREYTWTPKTTMHDFEVVGVDTENESFVAKGQGIGVLIIDSSDLYIKLIYSESAKKHGVHPVAYTKWRHKNGDKDTKECLDGDIWIGYDICYLSGPDASHRTDIHMTRASLPLEGEVFVPGLPKKLKKYNVKKRKQPSPSDNKEEEAVKPVKPPPLSNNKEDKATDLPPKKEHSEPTPNNKKQRTD